MPSSARERAIHEIQAEGNIPLFHWSGGFARRFNPSWMAILGFVLAGTILAGLELLAWQEFIVPHTNLVRCFPVDAVVTSLRLEEIGTGPAGAVIPRIAYQFTLEGEIREGTINRHPKSIISDGAEANVGEIRFLGPQRMEWAREYLAKYRVGQAVTAWVTISNPPEAMLVRQELDMEPFLVGLAPVLFVPFIWMFFAHVLLAMTGRPPGRWIGRGWSVLVLASLCPVFWQYQQLLEPGQFSVFAQWQNAGMNLALIVFVTSFLPAVFRSGMAIALILCLPLGIGLGIVITVFKQAPKPFAQEQMIPLVLVDWVKYGLYGGAILGLLLGIAGWRGWIYVWPNEDNPSFETGAVGNEQADA